jgi:hypothetical protein
MTQNRSQYTYNPDLPTRRWHQKWINPIISLQNAPPTSHGTPAPTKEDGETGQAGFKIRTWIAMDDDEDISEETLNEEIDWWSKPGAPLRPDLTASVTNAPVEEKNNEETADVMEIDPPTVHITETEATEPLEQKSAEQVYSNPPPSEQIEPPPPPPPPPPSIEQPIDTEMPDAHSSPLHPVSEPVPADLLQSTEDVAEMNTPTTLPQPTEPPATTTTTTTETAENPPESVHPPIAEPEQMQDILDHREEPTDPGSLSGIGGGIAGEGVAGGGNVDLEKTQEGNEIGEELEQKTHEEETADTGGVESFQIEKDEKQDLNIE